jgi:hypothetical protein
MANAAEPIEAVRDEGPPGTESANPVPEEQSAPMLDVHSLRHAPNTWRDFFVHIATISVGLLIAIGLEQTVEYFHRLHERHDLQAELRSEGLHNREGIRSALRYLDAVANWDLLAKQAVQNAANHGDVASEPYPPSFQPGPALMKSLRFVVPSASVWTTARTSGTVALLPLNDALVYARLYRFHELVTEMDLEWRKSHTALRGVEARFSDNVLLGHPDLRTLNATQLDQLSAALMFRYSATRELENELLAFRDGNEAVLRGIRDEDTMAAFVYDDQTLFGPATVTIPQASSP